MESQNQTFAPNLKNLHEQTTLKWIFVGGKGGVGKTTTAASVGIEMSKHRENVLIISTDPAHNLSDAFDQKFTSEPTQVKGYEKLFCLEIDPQSIADSNSFFKSMGIETEDGGDSGIGYGFLKELMSTIPGIDEAASFGEVMKSLDNYNFDLIIFDTAPTGHTMRLLNFPNILQKGLMKLIELKEKFGPMINKFQGMMSGGKMDAVAKEDAQKKLFMALDDTKKKIEDINSQFQDPELTTFVAVCIPEFLSLYETERLAIELAKFNIDIHNIVINQVIYPAKDLPCKSCIARRKMQDKYINQIQEIYDDFHLVMNPQMDDEVRGIGGLEVFANMLFQGYVQP